MFGINSRLHWQLVVPLAVAVMALFGALLWSMSSRQAEAGRLYSDLILHNGKGTVLLSRTNTALMELHAIVYNSLSQPDEASREKISAQAGGVMKLIVDRLAQARVLMPEMTDIAETERKLPDLKLKTEAILSAGKAGATAVAQTRASYDATVADIRLSIRKLLDSSTTSWDAETVSVSESVNRSIAIGIGLSLVGVAALLGIAGWLVVRVISRPIGTLTTAMSQLADGALSAEIAGTDRIDEIGTMARTLLVFKENLTRIRGLEEQERAASAARLARAQSMASVVTDVGEVVAAAANGDFSARLQIDQTDEQMRKLVAGINEINAVVGAATSEFADALSAVAAGDLTVRVDSAYRGKFAELKSAINDTVDRLSSTVKTIQLTSADVGLAAREINTGADDLSKRTEEQASSLEQTAATTEELAASVKASAQASRNAAAIADEAMKAAQNGGAIAGQAVEAMARIETASQKISDIIRVIDDIAFQTNLLALNAAVEAARAGDAGKGFAVVASEVRTLAQRSSEAAKDISALISSSNAEVGEGVNLVRQAGDQLSKILASSQKVAATIGDISAASGEQANGIEEMSQAVAHLDEMTQQNAALSEQSAASAASLSSRIGQLNDLVAAFKTGPEGASTTRAHQQNGSHRRAA